jgi:putative transposase
MFAKTFLGIPRPDRQIYSWRRRYAGLGLQELRELRQLREENRRLKGIVADLTLDKHILQEVLSKKADEEASQTCRPSANHASRSHLCERALEHGLCE